MQQLHGQVLRARVDIRYKLDGSAFCAVSVCHDCGWWVWHDIVVDGVVKVERYTRGVFDSCEDMEDQLRECVLGQRLTMATYGGAHREK
jgi:hypothetical protein